MLKNIALFVLINAKKRYMLDKALSDGALAGGSGGPVLWRKTR